MVSINAGLLALSIFLVQYPPTDRGNAENLMPLPTPPDVDNSNPTMPNLSSGFALGICACGLY